MTQLNFGIILTIGLGALVIIAAEKLRTKKVINNEIARKVVHTGHAILISTWPFFTTYFAVIIIELVSIAIALLARFFKFFEPLRTVGRSSWGELFFPSAAILLAILAPNKWIFVAAVLHFGLGDALAALVGQHFNTKRYIIFGHQKSLAGTLAFYLTSFILTFWVVVLSPAGFSKSAVWPALLITPLVATLAENFSPYGSDNFTVPILASLILIHFI
jgi:phytol kinase